MYFKVKTNPKTQEESVEIPAAAWVTVLVAIIGGLVTIATSLIIAFMVTKPQNDGDINVKKDDITVKERAQTLEEQKFQLELLQKALQVEDSQQRAQSLQMLVELGLLKVPTPVIVELTERPDNVPPLWLNGSTGKPASLSTSTVVKSIKSN